jgi:AcrR family transcriptional regulator
MRKGDATRQAILEQALTLGSRIGLNSLSIGRLADELGMSKSGLFGHFKSKEALQLQVLELAAGEFLDDVVRLAFREPKGEPRIRKLFENWLVWTRTNRYAGGCPFVQFSFELDDQPGHLRDQLLRQQRGWIGILAESARRAVAERHFRQDLDLEQFAHELQALMLGYHHASRLMRDENAEARVRRSFETLIANAKE